MYIAVGFGEDDGSKITTYAHLDVTDAFNLMTWSPRPELPAAKWTIFRAEDTDILRQFLRERNSNLGLRDPLLSHTCFFSASMLRDLASRYLVHPFIILQRVGDIVFIPAGCVHQVIFLLHRYRGPS